MSNRGLLAGWNNGLEFWLSRLRNNGLATRDTSSDAADPILGSALDDPSDLPHTHLSSSANARPVNAATNCSNNAADRGVPVISETARFVRTKTHVE